MALITTGTLIIGGIIVGALGALGVGGAIWAANNEEEREKERIEQLKQVNQQLSSDKNVLLELNNKLENARECLMAGQDKFSQGGHILGGVAFATKEINSCYYKLAEAIKYSNRLINDIDATIEYNKKEINK